MGASLKGYTHTLQYVWRHLIDSDTYRKTSVSDLHNCEKWMVPIELGKELPEQRTDLD